MTTAEIKISAKRKITIISLTLLFILLIIAGGLVYRLFFSHPFRLSGTAYMYIDRDDTADSVFHKIERVGKTSSIRGFRLLTAHSDYSKNIKTGKYAIRPTDNTLSLFRRLSAGNQTPVKFSFNNIRTCEQLAAVVGKQLMIDAAEIAARLYDSAFCAGLGYNEETVISLFIPNTYEIYWNTSVDNFFKRMQREYQTFWNDKRQQKAKEICLSPVEVSILASIVEEETNDEREKPIIAGLYLNRLRRGIPLQADPTIKFGLKEFGLKRILAAHLVIESPYNTYKYAGLPPGPIRIPSIKGIDSVLNYAQHNYIYMCAKEDFSGTHNFASDYATHQANAKRYRRALNIRNVK